MLATASTRHSDIAADGTPLNSQNASQGRNPMELKQIASFQVDHRKLTEGMYTSRVDGDVVTYDIRMVRPNCGAYLGYGAIHSFEHLFIKCLFLILFPEFLCQLQSPLRHLIRFLVIDYVYQRLCELINLIINLLIGHFCHRRM